MQTLRATAKIATMKRYLWLVFLVLAPLIARGADVSILCQASMTFTDNSPIPAGTPLKFNLYAGSLLDTQPTCAFKRIGLLPNTYNYSVSEMATVDGADSESDRSAPVQIVIPPADPICAGAPPNETRSQNCPAPTMGTFGQAHGWTSVAAPACWSADPWTPAIPPAGSCIVPTGLVTKSSVAYTTIRTKGHYVALPVGSVPLGAACDETQPVLNLFVLKDPSQVTFTGAKTVAPLGSCT